MIKFFRRIRQRLLKENRITQYLIYALGEIILVVIGILIALQINTWNNDRIEREEEQFIYKRLVQDLEQDIIGMDKSIQNFERRLLLGAHALKKLESPNVTQVTSWPCFAAAKENQAEYQDVESLTFGELLFRILVINLFYTTDNTFQELVSSGKMDLIRDDELKTLVQAHYPKMKQQRNFQENIIFTVQGKYRNALERNKISHLNKQTLDELIENGVDKKDIEVAIESFLSVTQAYVRDDNESLTSIVGARDKVKVLIKKIEAKIDK